jgi:hypothetical protein
MLCRRLRRQSRNRALAYIVAAGDAALCFARVEALAGLLLLVRGENRLAAEFDTVGLRVGSAARGAFEDAAAFEFFGHAKDRKDNLGKIRTWYGEKVRPANGYRPRRAACYGRQPEGRSCHAKRSTAGVMTTSPGARACVSFVSSGRLGRIARDLLAEHPFTSGRLELAYLFGCIRRDRGNASKP